MLKTEKDAIIKEYATHEGDTGSPEVQIAKEDKRPYRASQNSQEGSPFKKRPFQNDRSEKKPSQLSYKG